MKEMIARFILIFINIILIKRKYLKYNKHICQFNIIKINFINIERENALVSTPNNFLTEIISTYNYLGIKLEAYCQKMISKVTCYIGNVPIEINSGYKYSIHLFEAIKNNEEFIMCLFHPNQWNYGKWKQFKKLVKVLIQKPINKNESFKRI